LSTFENQVFRCRLKKSREILKQFWNFDSFRPMQEEIVDHVIYGHDAVVLLPTGGGKSICFQIPGIAREGITIVVSPLIALMQDQVKNLQNKQIRARYIISGMSYRDIDIVLDNARFGAIDFLYTSPERLKSELFIERFKNMTVGLIVVDEAHCISEWGHDFRPAYKEISALRKYHPEVPIIALTATATKKVQEDIIAGLQLRKPQVFEGSFLRPNLSYETYAVANKLTKIISFCENSQGKSGIIYCQTRKNVKHVARTLHALKQSVGIYHGGMNGDDRKIMLDSWLQGKTKIMVATNAFGMGIDKPDVHFVLHYDFPSNLEAYFQEAGRAGRDGNEAKAIVFWERIDLDTLKSQIERKFPPIEKVKLTYRALCNYLKIAIGSGNGETYPFDIKLLTQKFQLNNSETYHALKILELNGDLVFSENTFNPTRLRIAIGNKELYNFQIKQDKLSSLITLLTRSYPGIFDYFLEINELEVSKRLKITKDLLRKQLKSLEQYGVIDITWQTTLPQVTLQHERFPDDYLKISPEIYLNRKNHATTRLNAAINYLIKPICRQIQLFAYFGQQGDKCGTCDICLIEEQTLYSFAELISILKRLLHTPMSFSQIVKSVECKEQFVSSAIQHLMLEEIVVEKNQLFSLK
jgi:ATP-dependent DNA helicase RecQ